MGRERFAIFDVNNKEELISKSLIHFGLEHCQKSILAREAISSTDVVSGVALPHPLSEYYQETAIYVVINKKGIQWGKNKVQLVLFLFLNEDDRINYDQLFRELYYLVTSEEKLTEIYEVSSYEQYIKVLN
ncbi:PTS sugar transporter subunit IIA [Halobacillus sp. Marseille-P3879]|uniref:PTS sugar transporter subunit IIA n=1 Tax=Halobacillus sp. Marseille-P3879 TaxID=2045014 RepID=UPI00135AB73A|nr:PTS sugar transporter subunit IIA [Halobacillus sp. Marseille-P3879]